MEIEITHIPACEYEKQLVEARRASAAWETMANILLELETEQALTDEARRAVGAR